MAERYDAAILGAGADGLAAAALLARAGLRVVAVTGAQKPGGRFVTHEFHPGYFASPFADDVAEVPAELFWRLDLARHGALAVPLAAPVGLAGKRAVISGAATERLQADAARRRTLHLAAAEGTERPLSRWERLSRRREPVSWPREDRCWSPLAEVVAKHVPDSDEASLAAASALSGRSANPFAAGSALHLLAPPESRIFWRGGLGPLGSALAASALAAGAEIATGVAVVEIATARGRARAVVLADGSEVRARAVLSTLDAQVTFARLLPGGLEDAAERRRIANFRTSGTTARLLLALDAPPELPEMLVRRRIHLAPDTTALAAAHVSWLQKEIPEYPPVSVFVPSAIDPALAPFGGAAMTVTAGCIPYAPHGRHWTSSDRDLLRDRLLAAVERAVPGTLARIKSSALIVPPDVEQELGVTNGDLVGGEIAPDQIFAFRPFANVRSPFTPVAELYLAGASSAAGPLATGASGAIAAKALLMDMREGRLL